MKILIDKESIVKNENAGSTESIIHSPFHEPADISLRFLKSDIGISDVEEELKKFDLLVTNWSENSATSDTDVYVEMTAITAGIFDEDSLASIKKELSDKKIQWIGIEVRKPIRFFTHAPIKPYSYSYENPKVMVDCDGCSARFPYSGRGKSYYYDDYDQGRNDDDCCPFCEQDFEAEYETIKEALKR